jgi:putative hydrolase of the HAD superfamily
MDKNPLNPVAVVFDLGNVLLSFDSCKISRFVSQKAGAAQNDAHAFIFGTELEKSIDKGKISLSEFLSAINARFASNISIEEFTPVWCDMFVKNEGIEKIVRGLKNNNYRLGMLSNTNRAHFECVKEKFPVVRLFDDYHLSYETGYLKPDKQAFENVVRFYHCAPEQLVFTDDIDINVRAARVCGINAVRYESSKQLSSFLSGLSLKFKNLAEFHGFTRG